MKHQRWGYVYRTIRHSLVLLAVAPSLAGQNVAAAAPDGWASHVVLQNLEGALRYAYSDAGVGNVLRRQLEYRGTATVRVQVQKTGETYLQARGQTGSFQTAFNATDVGIASAGSAFNVKSLFFGQRIGSRLELEIGGIEFEYGAGSEATYGASSGWMNGYRARWRTSGGGWWQPSRIVVTAGYAGDFNKANFFSRSSRMGDVNHVQVLAQKPVSENAEVSAEFAWLDGIGLARNALLWRKIPAIVLDEGQVEGSIRTTDYVELGWAATARKHCFARAHGVLSARYSQVPRDFFVNRAGRVTMLNGGEILLGKRGSLMASAKPIRNLEVGLLVSRRLDADPSSRRWRAWGYASYDLREVATRMWK